MPAPGLDAARANAQRSRRRTRPLRIRPLAACFALACAGGASHAPERPDTIAFRDACDGSAAAALPGGLFVDANDETNLLRVYRLTGGRPVAAQSMSAFLGVSRKTEADIEAAATLPEPEGATTYWMTSHGRDKYGQERPERARLFATRWDGTRLLPVGHPRSDLRTAMLAIPALAAVAEEPPEDGGINVEGLADDGGGGLLVGFRSPLLGPRGLAMVVPLPDAAGLVQRRAQARFGRPILLDLGGRGVRSIERIGGRYLIVAGPVSGDTPSALYVWSGRAGDPPRPVPAPFADLTPEALIPLGPERLMVLSDDGSALCKNAPRAGKRFRGREMARP